jgi:hypothetical protein
MNPRTAILVGSILVALGCTKNEAGLDAGPTLPELAVQSEPGMRDLSFAITDYRPTPDGIQRLIVRGRFQGAPVEMKIALHPDWREQTLEVPGLKAFKGIVEFQSMGPGSDALIRAIDASYETRLNPKRFVESTTVSALSIEGTPQAVNAGPTKLKLFFEGSSDQNYAEAYLHIDLSKARLELREKDPQYRARIVRTLSGGS